MNSINSFCPSSSNSTEKKDGRTLLEEWRKQKQKEKENERQFHNEKDNNKNESKIPKQNSSSQHNQQLQQQQKEKRKSNPLHARNWQKGPRLVFFFSDIPHFTTNDVLIWVFLSIFLPFLY